MVTFRIGGMTIGQTVGQPQVTPFTLLARTAVPSVDHVWPVNMAQLLLGLDTTPGTDRITLPTTVPMLPTTTCFTCPNFDTEMTNAGFTLASEVDAIAHLKSQYAIWGSWATAVTLTDLRVITFMPDGTYMLADDDDPTVPGGADGMERGTYRWDASTNVFTCTVALNTDGTGGLSHPSPSQTPPYTFIIDASANTATFHFGPNVSDEIIFTRVIDATKLHVGAWRFEAPIPGFFTVLTLLSDGTFTVASDPIGPIPAGMERGTYVYDDTTGNVTLTTTVDTNGEFGVNESLTLPATTMVHAQINNALGGDFDFLRIDTGTETDFFDRIKVP
jgi:hypothetical protein